MAVDVKMYPSIITTNSWMAVFYTESLKQLSLLRLSSKCHLTHWVKKKHKINTFKFSHRQKLARRHVLFLKTLFIYFQREGKGRRKRGRETLMYKRYFDQLPFIPPQPGTRNHNPDKCPDWELNCQPSGSQAGTQSTGPHQPGSDTFLKNTNM